MSFASGDASTFSIYFYFCTFPCTCQGNHRVGGVAMYRALARAGFLTYMYACRGPVGRVVAATSPNGSGAVLVEM